MAHGNTVNNTAPGQSVHGEKTTRPRMISSWFGRGGVIEAEDKGLGGERGGERREEGRGKQRGGKGRGKEWGGEGNGKERGREGKGEGKGEERRGEGGEWKGEGRGGEGE